MSKVRVVPELSVVAATLILCEELAASWERGVLQGVQPEAPVSIGTMILYILKLSSIPSHISRSAAKPTRRGTFLLGRGSCTWSKTGMSPVGELEGHSQLVEVLDEDLISLLRLIACSRACHSDVKFSFITARLCHFRILAGVASLQCLQSPRLSYVNVMHNRARQKAAWMLLLALHRLSPCLLPSVMR